MKVSKHNLIWFFILCTSMAIGQKQTKNINDSFKVHKDVLVEINTKDMDIEVETWNKNKVSIQGIWEIEGMTKEDADKHFEKWDFEALANENKVVINLKSNDHTYFEHFSVFDDMDFDVDSFAYIGGIFNGDYYSELPPMPVMPPMPPMSPLPDFAPPVVEKLKELEFDYNAYQKDKEGYMKKFEQQQQSWEKEFEEKFAPQMKLYEKKMEEWQKKMEPQMKIYEEKMKEWEDKVKPKMKEYEIKMEKKLQKMEKEMELNYVKKMKEKGVDISGKQFVKKKLLIKVPSEATLKINTQSGKITLPDDIKTIE